MKTWPVLAFLAAAAAVILQRPAAASVPQSEPGDWSDWWPLNTGPLDFGPPIAQDEPSQLPSAVESLFFETQDMFAAPVPAELAARNTRAFLDLIAYAEGTKGRGDDGYNILFGGGTFASYADHPRQLITRTFRNGLTVTSSAAGRYQFLRRTWDELAQGMGLPNFGPASQDRAAVELIRRRGAMQDVRAGRIAEAVRKCAPTWASLPGSPYGQPTHDLQPLLAQFTAAGGSLEA